MSKQIVWMSLFTHPRGVFIVAFMMLICCYFTCLHLNTRREMPTHSLTSEFVFSLYTPSFRKSFCHSQSCLKFSGFTSRDYTPQSCVLSWVAIHLMTTANNCSNNPINPRLLFWNSFLVDGLQMFPRRYSSVSFVQRRARAWVTLSFFLMGRWSWR